MIVSLLRPSPLDRLFGVAMPLIGNIHVAPLPGTPRYRGRGIAEILARAIADAESYEKGGMDG